MGRWLYGTATAAMVEGIVGYSPMDSAWREGMRTQISEERTQIILLADTTSDALRDQTLLSKSKSFLESANFNFDNLGP